MSELAKKTLEKVFIYAKNYQLSTISGLAYGTDQYAHKLSIQYNIPTIAILGGGIQRFLRQNNRHILQKIIEQNGLIISEYDDTFEPTKYSFPQRNRIIAGLSNIVFIPEAGEKSGSLITANFAYKMKKPIYGTPNNIYVPQHQGLLQMMAENKVRLCNNINNMLLQHFSPNSKKENHHTGNISTPERQILEHIHKNQNISLQDLIQKCKRPSQELISITNLLELKGLIYQSCPGHFSLKR